VENLPADTIKVGGEFSIPEPQHLKTSRPEIRVPPRVEMRALRVDPTVKLDYQRGLETEEVYDEGSDRSLAAPLPAL
jgi:hypothetical protein